MKILRGIALGFWVMVMAGCVSLIASYFILSQTILSPVTVKSWLNNSGIYSSSLADVVIPKISTEQTPGADQLITDDMIHRAVAASITPEAVKAKVEPIIDATYVWLNSKSPEITFSVSTADDTGHFLTALRSELLTKLKTVPKCDHFVAQEDLIAANCLPPYVTPDTAADAIMQVIENQPSLQGKALTPESFAGQTSDVSKKLPDLVSYFWVAQLLAIPVFILVALFLIIRRRGGGLVAVASSLLTPGLTLLVLAAILHFSGATLIESALVGSDVAETAKPLVQEIVKGLTATTLQTGIILTLFALVVGGLGIWWRMRTRSKNGIKAQV